MKRDTSYESNNNSINLNCSLSKTKNSIETRLDQHNNNNDNSNKIPKLISETTQSQNNFRASSLYPIINLLNSFSENGNSMFNESVDENDPYRTSRSYMQHLASKNLFNESSNSTYKYETVIE